MKYRAILFDMDGTLLPMDTNEFTKYYFKKLYKKFSDYDLSFEKFIEAMWMGVGAMVKNDGSQSNETVFWKVFELKTGLSKAMVGETCEAFYQNEFNEAKVATEDNPLAKDAVDLAHKKANKVVLATNPLFPMVGQVTRMSWVSLAPSDFDLVTSYESDSTCKPNPEYFKSVCERINEDPSNCLMIGNDLKEDMYAASLAGLDTYLVSDWLIDDPDHPYNGKKGSFKDLINYLESLD